MLAVAIIEVSTLACPSAIFDASVSAAARGSRPVGGAPSCKLRGASDAQMETTDATLRTIRVDLSRLRAGVK